MADWLRGRRRKSLARLGFMVDVVLLLNRIGAQEARVV